MDRVIQQAISQVLSSIYENKFSLNSYGFRPRRGTHQALKQCKEYANDGYVYADDMLILCKSKRSALRTLSHIVPYIENKLHLRVNKEKTTVAHVRNIKFLGYSFYAGKKGVQLRAHRKSITKMKNRIKTLTSRSNGMGDQERKKKLNQYLTGWINYFLLANMKNLLQKTDEWFRRRIRMLIWKRWKKIKTRGQNLIKLGINKFKAWEFANTRKGYWHIANSPILSSSVTIDRLKRSGYIFFLDYYRKVANVN